MKFGQLIEYNMRNIFLKKSCTRYVVLTIPRPLYKKSKLSSGLTVWNVIQSVFIAFAIGVLPKYIKTNMLTIYFYLIQSFLKEYKEVCN